MTGVTLALIGGVLFLCAGALDVAAGSRKASRVFLVLGAAVVLVGSVVALPQGSGSVELWNLGRTSVRFHLDAAACWLGIPGWFMFGVAVITSRQAARGVHAGFALTALGALGVFGVTSGIALLVAWEIMSLGSAVLLLGRRRSAFHSRSIFRMLAMLEAGSVGLLLALVVIGPFANFAHFGTNLSGHGGAVLFGVGVLFLFGFGAKLGLGPFYEWYPGAYGAGSGASGVVFSGLVLNAAYFALGRALLHWLPNSTEEAILGTVVTLLGVVTAILAGLFAFVQGDWRRLLGLSTAENAGVAVTALGASLIFRSDHLLALAALAWLAGMIHLIGHAVTKGTLLEVADVVADSRERGRYRISSRFGPRIAGPSSIGGVIAAMSLAAMPPTIGFVSEWLILEMLFHDFTLGATGLRVVMVIAGAGVALTAALSLASAVKVIGIGLQGVHPAKSAGAYGWLCAALGVVILVMSGTAIAWVPLMGRAVWFDPRAASHLVSGWLITPLSTGFAFISPAMLETIGVGLALVPVALFVIARVRSGSRRVDSWGGGEVVNFATSTTTALSLSNALRTFFAFVYRPQRVTERYTSQDGGEVTVVTHTTHEKEVFAQVLARSLNLSLGRLARWTRRVQQGRESLYLALIGFALLAIFLSAFFVK